MASTPGSTAPWRLLTLLALAGVSHPVPLVAQGAGTGALQIRVTDDRGVAIPRATVTITGAGAAGQVFATDVSGRLLVTQMVPGDRELLVEQIGFVPVRFTHVLVVADETVALHLRLPVGAPLPGGPLARPVDGIPPAGTGVVVGRNDLELAGRHPDAVEFTAALTERLTLDPGWRATVGFGNGVSSAHTRLLVDGFEQVLLRHPGLPAEAPGAALFGTAATAQARYRRSSDDAILVAAPGGAIALASDEGGPSRAWLSWASGSVFARALDNPGDSATSTLAAGARIGSFLADGRGSWSVRAEYRKEADPTAAPFEVPGPAPLVRRSDQLGGEARLVLRPSPNTTFQLNAAGATRTETNPFLSGILGNADGSELSATDLFLGAGAILRGEDWQSTTRLGLSTARREWTTSEDDETVRAFDRIVTGGVAQLPGEFSERMVTLSEVLEMPWATHVVAIGGAVTMRSFTHDWLARDHRRVTFGSADDLQAGVGHLVDASVSGSAPSISVPEVAFFLQDTWQPNAHWRVRAGVRIQSQFLPDDLAAVHSDFRTAFGVIDTLIPADHRSGIGPRLSVGWDPGGAGRTLLEVAAGTMGGRYDPATLAEVARSADPIAVTRGSGTVTSPTVPPADMVVGQALSFFGPGVRAPRHYFATAGVAQSLAPGTTVSVRGGYLHTDFLLRRDNINLPAHPLAFDEDGRAIWGVLDHRGSLIAAEPGTNTRVTGFDEVWGHTSTGYSRQRFFSAALTHGRGDGIALRAEYTWSRTEDNLLGLLSADPADRAIVVDPAATEEWSDGRSDLDVPHQLAVMVRWGDGHDRLQAGARWRWRSGLPYTPGFAPGVDINGDGSSANDPVGLDAVNGVRGLLTAAGCTVGNTAVAARNSCRSPAVHGLDLDVRYGFMTAGARRLDITLEGFNLIASNHGIPDRAAVLVDPAGALSLTGEGTVVLPLVLNDHFGQLQSRRTAPRTIRIGLRLEN